MAGLHGRERASPRAKGAILRATRAALTSLAREAALALDARFRPRERHAFDRLGRPKSHAGAGSGPLSGGVRPERDGAGRENARPGAPGEPLPGSCPDRRAPTFREDMRPRSRRSRRWSRRRATPAPIAFQSNSGRARPYRPAAPGARAAKAHAFGEPQAISSTRCAREGPGSNGSPKYCVSRVTLPSRNSMTLTV